MSTELFPSIQPQAVETETELSLFKEIAWDFEKDMPIFKNGSPSIISGKDAVLVWAWKALHTPRCRHEIYTWDYGNETESLIGQPFTDDLKRSEAARYVKECLLVNPYISDVSNITVSFLDGAIKISCTIKTVYGEAELDV
ncbi:MAG: DUF2634 domain-containing protein [Clostridiales bacterium]|nr:DUF2634 domain-containing protein [Clostridiales bacterium]